MGWMDEFDEYPGRVIECSGYSVKTVVPFAALRYRRGSRALTVSADLVDVTSEVGRAWFILPVWALAITLPEALRWDDGGAVAPEDAERIKEEISSALSSDGRRHFFDTEECRLAPPYGAHLR